MRTFSPKQNQTQKPVSASLSCYNPAKLGPDHRVHHSLDLQRIVGDQEVAGNCVEEPHVVLTSTVSPRFQHGFSRILIHPRSAGAIQSNLEINRPGDEFEQEADRVSEQVMRMPEPQLRRVGVSGGVCPRCQVEQLRHGHERLQTQRVESSNLGQNTGPPIGATRFGSVGKTMVSSVELTDRGHPLSASIRAFFEPRLDFDLSEVRIHSDAHAAAAARDIDALAFTIGLDVVFGQVSIGPKMMPVAACSPTS